MAGLLYFLPEGMNWEAFKRERAHIFKGAKVSGHIGVADGPTGKPGEIFAVGASPPKVGFYPQAQTWLDIPGHDWRVGYQTDAPPTPSDLARAVQLKGHGVALEDGAKWIVPVARICTGKSVLPAVFRLNSQGQPERHMAERFQQFAQDAEAVYHDFIQSDQPEPEADAEADATDEAQEPDAPEELTLAEGWRIAVTALGFNYHMGAEEISALGLMGDLTMPNVLQAIIDWPTVAAVYAEMAKKKESETDAGENT